MVERQYCFEVKEVGANLDIKHDVFNLLYLVDIFEEFYPEEFDYKKIKSEQSTIENPKEIFSLILWGKSNNRESYRELEKWYSNNDETCQLVVKCKKPGKNSINRFKNQYVDLIYKFDQF